MENSKVLITGARGLLGDALTKVLLGKGYQVEAINFDISNRSEVLAYAKDHQRPDWLLHAAALTDVNLCEQDKKRCYEVNVLGTKHLRDLAAVWQTRFLYISTASVFSGEQGNYSEVDRPNPLNYYSFSKLLGEEASKEYPLSLILRINLIGIHSGGSRGKNFLEWLFDSFKSSRDLKLYEDVMINPLSNWTLAAMIEKLLNLKPDESILHLTSSDVLSKAAIGRLVNDYFKDYRGKLEFVKLADAEGAVKRPNNFWLNADLAAKQYGFKPPALKEEVALIFKNFKYN